jgi:hypothetical protein
LRVGGIRARRVRRRVARRAEIADPRGQPVQLIVLVLRLDAALVDREAQVAVLVVLELGEEVRRGRVVDLVEPVEIVVLVGPGLVLDGR